MPERKARGMEISRKGLCVHTLVLYILHFPSIKHRRARDFSSAGNSDVYSGHRDKELVALYRRKEGKRVKERIKATFECLTLCHLMI